MLDKLHPDFVLASSSPQRVTLLRQIGIIPDRIVKAEIDETPFQSETPIKLAERLSLAKAKVVAENNQRSFVLAADTVVACGKRALLKAKSIEQARSFLELLSGRRHRVYSGVTIISPSNKVHTRVVITRVIFKRLSRQEVENYVETDEWQNKSGAYAIQGRAAKFVRSINGSYSNVVGLPLFETSQILLGVGFKL